MSSWTPFGPGTITVGTVPLDFSCEVLGGKIGHEYEDVGSTRTTLCGERRGARKRRTDRVKLKLENDLTATGLYAWLQSRPDPENPDPEPIVYTPNTEGGAKWEGSIFPTLPGEIGADEYESPIGSEVDWEADGLLAFTAETVTP
jgi:hypothetical protein